MLNYFFKTSCYCFLGSYIYHYNIKNYKTRWIILNNGFYYGLLFGFFRCYYPKPYF